MNFRDPFDPREPDQPREHYEDCPVRAEDAADGDCTCAQADIDTYEDAMERRVDALRDREHSMSDRDD